MAKYRPRKIREEGELMGSDSFMDIVCNMVGIVIILIMVAGTRSERVPRVDGPEAADPTAAKLRDLQSQAHSLEEDVLRLAGEIEQVQVASGIKFQERRAMALGVEQGRQQIAEAMQRFDAARRSDFEMRRADMAMTSELAGLDQAIELAQKSDHPTVQIVSYPTPISKTVNGKEIHFQIRNGRIALVPIEELLDRLPAEMRRQRDKLLHASEVTGTAGPIDSFRIQYVFERDGNYIRLYECQFLPTSPQIGEPVDMALAETSEFRNAIADINPQGATVTLWTYPDSFIHYRRVKEELYKLGFAVAGRPQPANQPIGGSPRGSKSHAE